MEFAEERALLARSQKGDLSALGSIYDRYHQGLFRYARRLLGDETLAEDCVAETFSRFLKALQQNKGPRDHLQAYLYRIAHNWITDQYRKERYLLEELDDSLPETKEQPPESQLIERAEQERIRQALSQLPPSQRQVIVLRFIEEWGNEAVALALQKPVGAVKALQHRALINLRKHLS